MASPTLTFQEGLITLPQELTDFLIQLENYLNDLKQIRTETIDHLKNQIDESLHQWSEKIHELKIQLTHLPQEIKNHDIILNLKKRLENCEAKANSCYLNLCSAIHDSQTKRNWHETFIQFATSLKKYREEAAKLAKETQSFSVRQMLEKMAQGGKILASRTRLQWRRKIFHTFNGLFGLWLWGYSGLSEFAVIMILATFLSFAIGTEILRRVYPPYNEMVLKMVGSMMRERERTQISSATWYMAAIMILFLFFPKVVGILALWYVAMGDTFAGIIGTRYGRHKLSTHLSVEGSLAAFTVCFVGTLFFARFGFDTFILTGSKLWIFSLCGGMIGAAAEASFKKIDDNLVIPLVSAPLLWGLTKLFSL